MTRSSRKTAQAASSRYLTPRRHPLIRARLVPPETRQPPFDKAGEQRGAERQSHIVEVVIRVVNLAGARAVAVADLDVRAGNPFEHVREILGGHRYRPAPVDVLL